MKKDNKSKSGFTLVEAMVSMVILTLAIGGSLATFGLSMRSIESSNQHMQAVHSLRAVYEDYISTLVLTDTTPANNQTTTTWRYGYRVQHYMTNKSADTRNLFLTVRYRNNMGNWVDQTMQTVLSEHYY